MGTLLAFFFVLIYIVVSFVRILTIEIHKRVPSFPRWLPAFVVFGMIGSLIGVGIHKLNEEAYISGGIRVPLSVIVKKPLSGGEVFYTDDAEFLRAVYNGEYPGRLKTISLDQTLSSQFIYQAELLKSLEKSTNFHTASRAFLGKSGFVVSLSSTDTAPAPNYLLIYFPQTGELGRGKDWCDVPPEFRKWMATLKPGVSVAVPTPANRRGINVNGTFIPTDDE